MFEKAKLKAAKAALAVTVEAKAALEEATKDLASDK